MTLRAHKRWGLALKFIVSATIIGFIVWRLGGVGELGQVVSNLNPIIALLVFLVITSDRALMTYKWALLLRSQGTHLPLLPGMRIYCSSMIWGMFLPATVGADAIRAYAMSRRGLDTKRVVASIIVERMIGFLAALFVGLIGFFLLSRADLIDSQLNAAWWIGGATLAVAALIFAGSFHHGIHDLLMRALVKQFGETTIVGWLRSFNHGYRGYSKNKLVLAVFFGLSFAEQFVFILYVWLIAVGLGVDVKLMLVAGALPLALLISRIPISIQGIGLFDGIFVVLLAAAGVPLPEAVTIALLIRVFEVGAWLPWWLAQVAETGTLHPARQQNRV